MCELATNITPLKINMEHNHGGLEDHFPFFSCVSMLIFQGVYLVGGFNTSEKYARQNGNLCQASG